MRIIKEDNTIQEYLSFCDTESKNHLKQLEESGQLTAENINMNEFDILQDYEQRGTISEAGQSVLNTIRKQWKIQELSGEHRSLLAKAEEAAKAYAAFIQKYSKTFETYSVYVYFIEKELMRIDFGTYNIWTMAEATEAYIRTFKKESAPEQISNEEKTEIKKFLCEYVRIERTNAEPIPSLSEINGFVRMLQGRGTNNLAQMSSRRIIPQIDNITGRATINYKDLTAYIDNYNDLPGLLNLNALILLDFCALYLSQLNNYGNGTGLTTAVNIPLSEYMRRCGIPITKASTDKARREAKAALETLYNLSIEFDETKKGDSKKKPEHYHMRILQERSDIKNGIIYARFGQSFVEYLNQCGLMEYSTALLKIDRRNPTAYHMGRKLCYHSSMDNNRKRGTSNNISVKALLECCPDLPNYEEVSETDRHYIRRIIDPFEAALDYLKNKDGFLESWEYCSKLKAPLTDEQLTDLDYDTFIKLQIKFVIANAPDPKERLAAKAETTKKRNAKKHAAINKACKNKAEIQSEG